MTSRSLSEIQMLSLLLVLLHGTSSPAAEPPKVGDKALDFELKSLAKDAVKLSDLTSQGPVVVLVLRGYPGYQCPLCNKQVGEFVTSAEQFAKFDARIVLVYPGSADKLAERAQEFITGKTLPDNVILVIDPDYAMLKSYGLRWDAPRETAYPATFVIGRDQKVTFAKISKTHGGRTKASEVLAEVQKLK